jgi:hypothetical protein
VKRRLARLALVALALAGLASAVGGFLGWRKRLAEHHAKRVYTTHVLVELSDTITQYHKGYPDCRETWPPTTENDDDGTGWWTFRHSIEGLDSSVDWRFGPKGHVLDGWDRPIHYRRPGLVYRRGWEFVSLGPDGELDTPDDMVIGEDIAPVTTEERVASARAGEEKKLADTRAHLEGLAKRARALDAQGKLPPGNGDERSGDALLEGIEREFMDDQDGWLGSLRYAHPGPVHPNGWDVWSPGPNGIDERGRGDDILIGEDVAPIKTSTR